MIKHDDDSKSLWSKKNVDRKSVRNKPQRDSHNISVVFHSQKVIKQCVCQKLSIKSFKDKDFRNNVTSFSNLQNIKSILYFPRPQISSWGAVQWNLNNLTNLIFPD